MQLRSLDCKTLQKILDVLTSPSDPKPVVSPHGLDWEQAVHLAANIQCNPSKLCTTPSAYYWKRTASRIEKHRVWIDLLKKKETNAKVRLVVSAAEVGVKRSPESQVERSSLSKQTQQSVGKPADKIINTGGEWDSVNEREQSLNGWKKDQQSSPFKIEYIK